MKNQIQNKEAVSKGKIVMMDANTKQPMSIDQFDHISDDTPICFSLL